MHLLHSGIAEWSIVQSQQTPKFGFKSEDKPLG